MFIFDKRYLHPKYLALALVLFFFWLLARLPNPCLLFLGRILGWGFYLFSRKTRRTTEVNLRLAMKGRSDEFYRRAVKQSCLELGISIMETFFLWFNDPDKFVDGRFEIEGQEHWDRALAGDKGVLVILIHIGSIDTKGILMKKLGSGGREVIATYRDSDPVVNRFLELKRTRLCDRIVSSTDQRAVMSTLRKKGMVWYPADIEVKGPGSVFVNFMDEPAATTTIISRLAKAGKAAVVPFVYYRDPDTLAFRGKVFPALDNFPTKDVEADTARVNEVIAKMLEPQPFRYWWCIKRYKHQPDGSRRDYS
ncbi:lysophospholipid acyltransferase family protein [Agaribacterium haliotis]|uniref:lysophospholipid acyltransferase family protein n=1 Tax=Agaribacterium haliotis TaxID=2013869 RepID=UPI0013045374|nr:lysophospholipid acyltransferase family protein [Agaribacterium haliotis]